ncbi:MAG: nicotinate phosphoribosyltransferase [Halobacteria archaeon]
MAEDPEDRKYDFVTQEDIDQGRLTDAYFLRTEEILEAEEVNPHVIADVGDSLERWHVFTGLKDVAKLLEGKPVSLYSIPEGTLFKKNPVMYIEGNYLDFCRLETAILGFICQSSGIATNAMRVSAASGDTDVLSFGSRRQHPATAAMIERSALIGGMDGISNVAGGEVIGRQAGGTMPHALVISMNARDPEHPQEAAWDAYNRVLDPEVPRIMLCDTYDDERDETVRAAELLGDDIDGVRLDTTSSRKGDFREIIEEVRWELEVRGYEDVKIFVSGGVTPEDVIELRDVADGFGVGGYVANANPVDFSLNIVEVEGDYAAKRGEKSGRKQVYRRGFEDTVAPADADLEGEGLIEPVVEDGEIVMDFSIDDARERVLKSKEALMQKDDLELVNG